MKRFHPPEADGYFASPYHRSAIRSSSIITITTKVEGNFDRTGLPDPVIINHHVKVDGDKIVGLTCRLADERPAT